MIRVKRMFLSWGKICYSLFYLPVQFKKTALNLLEIPSICVCFNRIAHLKCKILSSFIHLLVVLNLCDIHASVGNKCMERTCNTNERISYMTWGRVNKNLFWVNYYSFSRFLMNAVRMPCFLYTFLFFWEVNDACLILVDAILTSLGLFFIHLQN